MSEEQLKAFLEKVKSDTSLQEKLKAAADVDAALAIAKEAGFAITEEDIHSMQSATTEMSDDELEDAAGGGPRMSWAAFYTGCILWGGSISDCRPRYTATGSNCIDQQ